jgi:hypothetical protein
MDGETRYVIFCNSGFVFKIRPGKEDLGWEEVNDIVPAEKAAWLHLSSLSS